jgi:hypothetical protein
MRKLSFCTFALCLGVASITHAAPTVTKVRFTGNTVSGSAASGDNGCFSASLGVTASDEVSKDGTGTTTSKKLNIGYGGFDRCEFLSFGGNITTTLTVPIANQTSVTFPFDILVNYANTETNERFEKHLIGTVTITASGDFEKSRRTEISQNQTMRTVTRSKGNTREATLSVSAKLDGVPQSLPITEGEIGTVRNGTIEITRY